MPSVRQLSQLQERDREADAYRNELAVAEERIGDDRELQELRRQVDELQLQLQLLHAQQREHEDVSEGYRHKVVEVEAKLYGGTVHNPRELSNLQEELRQLRALQKPEDDVALGLMEQSEALGAELQQMKVQLARVQEEWEIDQAALKIRRVALVEELARLDRQRPGSIVGLDAATMSLYELLRSSRQGHAVAKVGQGMCGGCRLRLPTGELQRARAGRELVQCPSCSRILYAE